MKKNLMERMTQALFGGEIRRQVRAALSAAETEATFLVGARGNSTRTTGTASLTTAKKCWNFPLKPGG